MPCMRPDLEAARKRGNQIGQELLARLIDEHSMLDISTWKDKGILILPGADARWTKAKEDFIKAVEELFVEDEANGF
jgi:hypothetical protein